MNCQSLHVLSNVCTVLVGHDQRSLVTEHASEMQKLRAELAETKANLECTRRVLDRKDREALYWQDRHHQLAAIVQGLQGKLASGATSTPETMSESEQVIFG